MNLSVKSTVIFFFCIFTNMFNFQSHKIFIFMNTYNNLEYTFIKTNTDHIIIIVGNFYFFFFMFNLPITYILFI